MKRVLIISNAALSNTDSNGRTVSNLFRNYDNKKLAQFCVYGNPDFSKCQKYYKVTDKDALKSLLTFRQCGGIVEYTDKKKNTTNIGRTHIIKTPLKVLLREFAWRFGRWNGGKLKEWLDDFNPEVVFINLADNCFTINLALMIAEKYSVPIVAFSTENYYFKSNNYLTKNPSLLYKAVNYQLKKSYKRLEKKCIKCFLNTSLLRDLYASEFSFECDCSYCKSEIDFIAKYKANSVGELKISYLGNLGLKRHKALIEIGTALNKFDRNIRVYVYGKAKNPLIEEELRSCSGIKYMGFVSYEEVKQVIHSSDLLIHVEYSSGKNNEDLKYAFSTKIADSVCSGTPLFVYADESLAVSKFLINKGCAFFETEKGNLEKTLLIALFNEEARRKVLENSKIVSEKYFKNNSEVEDFISQL